jgi:phosphoribosyl-ATP pyrophosphohydrolase/phosphoribosyl-AMP cyclohydrolase
VTLPPLKTDAAGLITVVAQDARTGEIRMVAHADQAALERTIETGEAHFFSRSRGRMWRKGEESGNVLRVEQVWIDCDADAVIYLVVPHGPTCHTGQASCFFAPLHEGRGGSRALPLLARLEDELERRRSATTAKSYTRSLLDGGAEKIGAKLREEADELARAIAGESDERVVSEAADVVYHLMVGLLHRGVSLADVETELARRFGVSGHDEKARREPK